MLPTAAFWVAGWAAGAHPRAAAICKNLRLVFIGIVLRGLMLVLFRERVHRSYRKDQGVRIGGGTLCCMDAYSGVQANEVRVAFLRGTPAFIGGRPALCVTAPNPVNSFG